MPLNELLTEYERIRKEEQQALYDRRKRAEQLHAGFINIAKARNEATKGVGAALRKGADTKQAAIEAQSALYELEQQEAALLRELQLPLDYLTLHFHCSLCKDTGFVGEAKALPCVCLKNALLEEERFSSQINAAETFDTFDESIYPNDKQRTQMRNAKKAALAYAQALPNTKKHNFILLGMAGLGKSFLLNSIAFHALSRGIAAKKISSYTLFEEILKSIRQNDDTVSRFINLPLLLIDDLGAEPTLNNITREYLFIILNERRNGKKHTAIASNLDIAGLQEAYGERVFSRLISADDSEVLLLTGENLRYANVKKRISHDP